MKIQSRTRITSSCQNIEKNDKNQFMILIEVILIEFILYYLILQIVFDINSFLIFLQGTKI